MQRMLFEFVYNRFLRRKRGSGFAYRLFKKIGDPVINTVINDQMCLVPFSHMGVVYQNWYELYDRQLSVVATYVKKSYKRNINIIDVGANVGDSIMCIGDKENTYLAIEGVEKYYSLLKKNLVDYSYSLCSVLCGEKEKKDLKIDVSLGTAKIIKSNSSNCCIKSLDDIVEDNRFEPDLLKIDTDGYDFSVIRSGINILSKCKPVLYFEWTAPELLENGEDLVGIFPLLYSIGYKGGVLLDKYGIPMCVFDTGNISFLKDIIGYSLQTDMYYDVVLINSDTNMNIYELWNLLIRKID